MPSIKDFDSKKREKKGHVSEKAHKQEAASGQRPKRRPGRPDKDEHAEVIFTEQAAEYVSTTTTINENTDDSTSNKDPFRLEFFGSDLLREKAPKTFELAEAVAEDWVKDGDFRTLPLGNPWAQVAASQGLQKMKKVEKKLEEIGLIPLAQMGLALVKAKLKIK
jgi:hypothetical protein